MSCKYKSTTLVFTPLKQTRLLIRPALGEKNIDQDASRKTMWVR